MGRLQDLFFPKPAEPSPGFFAHLVKEPSPVILEIGCNDGSHTLDFLQAFPKARLHCFEPDGRAIARFHQKVSDPRVSLYPIALGSVDGTARFFASGGNPLGKPDPRFPADWDLSGSLHPPLHHLRETPGVTFPRVEEVPIRRLDSVAREIGLETIDLIWADVQGAEIDLIAGGRETLRNTRFFYTEYSDRELYAGQINLHQLRALLPEFRLLQKFRHDVLFANRAAL